MSIQRIHTVPSDLPHARLYLDDLEEISRILVDALVSSSDEGLEQSRVVYRVGDLRMDSIDDLQQRGGSAKELEMQVKVGPYRELGLRFSGMLEPSLRLYSLKDPEHWAVYAKIKSIFERRQLTLKNSIASLPSWLKWTLYALFVLIFPNTLWVLHVTRPVVLTAAAYYIFLTMVFYEV